MSGGAEFLILLILKKEGGDKLMMVMSEMKHGLLLLEFLISSGEDIVLFDLFVSLSSISP